MTKFFLKFFFATLSLCLALKNNAQDVHFSQYNASPLFLNPALAGLNMCDYRVYANFRIQWMPVSTGNTYRTFAGGADMAVGKITKYNSFAGLGISFFADQAGDISFNSNRVDLSFAYHFMLNRKATTQLSVGIQGAFNHRSIDPAKATFDSQYNPATGQFEPNGTIESFGRTRVIYGDAGFGILYSMMIKRDNNFYMGFALNHLNQPKISFYPSGQNVNTTENERLSMKFTIHTGAAIPIGTRLTVMPNLLFLLQGRSNQFNVGCNFKTTLGANSKTNQTAFHVGLQYRGIYDAIIISTRFDYKGFSCGLSYDVNVSKLLPATNSVGAPEISLMFQGCSRKKPRPGHCPVML